MTYQTRTFWKKFNMNFFDESQNPEFRTGVWATCPLLGIQADPSIASKLEEDFTEYHGTVANANPPTMTGYTATQSNTTGGLSLSSAYPGGILDIDSEGAAQSDSLQLQLGDNGLTNPAVFKCAANKDLWFEARFKIDEVASARSFVGLARIDTTIMPSGNLDTGSDYIGFGSESGAGASLSFYECKDAAELSDDTTTDLVDDTYVRVGFYVEGTTAITAYIDDVPVSLTNVIATGIPTTDALVPTFHIGTHASTADPIMSLDYFKVVQLR